MKLDSVSSNSEGCYIATGEGVKIRRYSEKCEREYIVYSQQSDDSRFSSHRYFDRSHMR